MTAEHPLISALGWDNDSDLSPENRAIKATVERLKYQIPPAGLTNFELKTLLTDKHREMAQITDWLDAGILGTTEEVFSLKEAIKEIEGEIVLLLTAVPIDVPVLSVV